MYLRLNPSGVGLAHTVRIELVESYFGWMIEELSFTNLSSVASSANVFPINREVTHTAQFSLGGKWMGEVRVFTNFAVVFAKSSLLPVDTT